MDTTIDPEGKNRVKLSERIRVLIQNLSTLHVSLAVKVLSRAINKDPGLYDAWHSTITMSIHDEGKSRHVAHDKGMRTVTVPNQQCVSTADRIMRNLFGTRSK